MSPLYGEIHVDNIQIFFSSERLAQAYTHIQQVTTQSYEDLIARIGSKKKDALRIVGLFEAGVTAFAANEDMMTFLIAIEEKFKVRLDLSKISLHFFSVERAKKMTDVLRTMDVIIFFGEGHLPLTIREYSDIVDQILKVKK